LQSQEPDRPIYLAIPKDTYETFFKIEFVQAAISEYRIALIVFDPEKEVIVKWQA
jgi:hypothetical protein